MATPLSCAQQDLLALELPRTKRMLTLLTGMGLPPGGVELFIMVDVRCELGRALVVEGYGETWLEDLLHQPENPNTATLPVDNDVSRIVAVLAPELLADVVGSHIGKIPVLLVDSLGELGVTYLDRHLFELEGPS